MNKSLKPIFTTAAVIVACVLAYVTIAPGWRDMFRKCRWINPGGSEILEKQAAPVIKGLEEYRVANGLYPASLANAGLSENTPNGPWRYQPSDQRASYYLKFGDYGACFWESTYNSKDLSWYHDS